jgi:hypothetical protein
MDPLTRVMAGVLTLLTLAGCTRMLYMPNAPSSPPSVILTLLDVTSPGAATEFAEAHSNDNTTLFIPPGRTIDLAVRAEGSNGVVALWLQSSVDGGSTTFVQVRDPIDRKGYVSKSLFIAGSDGFEGPGNQAIQLHLTGTQSATIVATGVAPQDATTEIHVRLRTDCGCPYGAAFSRTCECGCLANGPVTNYDEPTDQPLSPLCNGACCRSGELCGSTTAGVPMCGGVSDPSLCADGRRCNDPAYPICQNEQCYPKPH